MKRIAFLFLAAACSSAEDDVLTDASIDQTTDSKLDAPQDVTTKDASDASDATTTTDASDASDAADEGDATTSDVVELDVVLDQANDVVTIDATSGCVDNNACTSQEFCDKGTANCNGVGKCTPIPQFCPQIVNPVCGCDKKTYNNSCYANKGLTSVAYTGACE